jgi:ABC-2 type transport system ATP-binding protein
VPGAALETRELTKRFGSLVALDNLTIAVEPGEVFGFLGPNGAGKTTTIRLLLDFLRATSGSAALFGQATTDPASRARVGFLPADLHLSPRYTGNDVLELHGAMRGGLDQAWTATLLDRFGLDPTRPVGELSTGNRRKLGVVQAFAHRPDLVILDEPTSGLDPLLQQEFLALVREVVADGAAVFLSSHILPEVEHVADRVGVLRRGQLVLVAGVEELRSRAHHHLELHLAAPPPPDAFADVAGVASRSIDGVVVRLVIGGNADAVIKEAAKYEVVRVVAPESDLEDVFLDLYRDPT